MHRLLPAVVPLVAKHGLQAAKDSSSCSTARGFSSCGSPTPENRLSSPGTLDLVAPQHMGSSWTRDQTYVPCIAQADSQPLDHQSSVIFGPGTTENHVTEGPDTREDYITPDPVTMEDYTTPDLRTT